MALRRRLVDAVALAARAAGLPGLLRRRRHRRGDYRVFILEYHEVCGRPDEESEGTVSAQRLERHLRFLAPHFEVVTVAEAARRLSSGGPGRGLDHDLLVLTFDDGYRGNYRHAWPVLRRLGMVGTVYLATDFLDGEALWFDTVRRALQAMKGRELALPASTQDMLRTALGEWPMAAGRVVGRLKYAPLDARVEAVHALAELELDRAPAAEPMSWGEAMEMIEQGAEMGAHTVTHPILSRLSASQQEDEIARSRRRIAEATGHQPTTFAVPNGSSKDYDQATLDVLRRLGFTASVTTERGSNMPGCDLFTLRRLGIGSDSDSLLAARLAGLFDEGLRRFRPGRARAAPAH